MSNRIVLFCGSWLNLFFQHLGLEISSTSYAGRPGKVALKGNFLGVVRNIRVEISNRFYDAEKQISATRKKYYDNCSEVCHE